MLPSSLRAPATPPWRGLPSVGRVAARLFPVRRRAFMPDDTLDIDDNPRPPQPNSRFTG